MTFRSLRPALVGLVAFFSVLPLTGCGDPATVRGTVTLDGAPASDGSVNFEPADGQGPNVGAKVTDGKFEIPATSRMKPGKWKATVNASAKTGKQIPAGPPAPPGTMIDELKFYPGRGVQPDVREVELKSGDNELSLDVIARKGGGSPATSPNSITSPNGIK